VAITLSGFSVALYPWWLVTAKSLIYYNRLKTCSNAVIAVALVLAVCRSVLAPVKPFSFEDNNATTVQFRLVSSLYWISVLVGPFIFIPVYIRRLRIFQSHSLALYLMVIPFILVMLVSVFINEWSGNSFFVSYSPFILMLLFACTIIAETYSEKKSRFDEAYIMVVGECAYV
jgi:hypothetical protein